MTQGEGIQLEIVRNPECEHHSDAPHTFIASSAGYEFSASEIELSWEYQQPPTNPTKKCTLFHKADMRLPHQQECALFWEIRVQYVPSSANATSMATASMPSDAWQNYDNRRIVGQCTALNNFANPCRLDLHPTLPLATAVRVEMVAKYPDWMGNIKHYRIGAHGDGCAGKSLSDNPFLIRMSAMTNVGKFGWSDSAKSAVTKALEARGRKQEGRETLEEVGEEVDNNMTNNMTNMTNNRQISETVCQELLNKTCPIMDRFEAWTTPANGHFVQDPPIGQENDVRITTEWGEQFALIASKKRMETVGESIVQKWMLCIRRVVPETPYLPEKCCVSKYSVLSKHAREALKSAENTGAPISKETTQVIDKTTARLKNF